MNNRPVARLDNMTKKSDATGSNFARCSARPAAAAGTLAVAAGRRRRPSSRRPIQKPANLYGGVLGTGMGGVAASP